MQVFHSDAQAGHAPQRYAIGGEVVPARETPERVDALLAALRGAGHPVLAPRAHGLAPLRRLHTEGYLEFLRTAHARWKEAFASGPRSDWVLPYAFPNRHMDARPGSVLGQAGWYLSSTTVPIGAGTWAAIAGAADCALDGAEALLAGEREAYALCRPPGHHAYADVGAGFCYVNNAAVAAEHLVRRLGRVAVLDVDVHHGNGTQGLFYERADVLFVSVHADPDAGFPFFAGRADETGRGAGAGFNLNLPLPAGTRDAGWLDAVAAAAAAVRRFEPAALVVSLGFDAFERDPSALLSVSTEGFRACGRTVGALGLPTLLVQEGGYAVDALGANLLAFLEGFGRSRS
ncbi:MAG: acetylpolyamine amidohydrolase [Pseudomonadota bacterium]|jgi:acetoin utilization deacetylase AcuC-like enzyme